MPINKTKAGTFTIKGGNGSSSDPYNFWAIYDENNTNLVKSSYGSGIYVTRTIGAEYVKVELQGGINYKMQSHSDDDGWIRLYNSNWEEIYSDDDSCYWDYNFFENYGYPFSAFSYTPSTTGTYYVYFPARTEGTRRRIFFISPSPLYDEDALKKIYNNSPNFDEQGYMVDYFDLKEPKLDAPIVAKGGLDFDLSFNEGLKERITGITGIIEDKTYFELTNDNTVGTYLLCKKIFGSKKKVNFPGTENLFQYGTGDFTVSFWMKAPNWVGFAQSVLSKHDGSSGFSIFNTVNNTTDASMEMRISQSGSNVDLSSTALGEDKWVHWLYMRKNNYGYWYKNGEKITEVSLGEKNINNNAPLEIGFSNCLDYAGANFGIKSLKVYGKSMKDYEIIGLSKEFRI